jgi:hypothetical protein
MRSNDRFGLMHEYAKVGYVWWTMMCHNSKLRLYLRAIVSLAANTRYFSFMYMPLLYSVLPFLVFRNA